MVSIRYVTRFEISLSSISSKNLTDLFAPVVAFPSRLLFKFVNTRDRIT